MNKHKIKVQTVAIDISTFLCLSMLVFMYDRTDRTDRTLTATLGADMKLTARCSEVGRVVLRAR